jgi:hypothetical protein
MSSLGLSSQSSFNKYKKGTLKMRDSSDLRGFIKLGIGNTIKFKKTKKDKKQTFDYKKVTRVKFLYEDEYLYKIIEKRKKIILIKRNIKGKLNLYSYVRENPGMSMSVQGSAVLGASTNTIYFIGKENSDLIEELPSIKNRKFIKTLSKFTSHCKVFINMIKDKENIDYYFEKKEREFKTDFENNDSRIEDMVNYYNSNCG